MKKTPIFLMSTALLSVPYAEGTAKTTSATNSPIIKTALMRYLYSSPCLETYYSMVAEYAPSTYFGEITGELYFVNDLGYNSFAFLELLQAIVDEFFDKQLDLSTSDFTLNQNLKIEDVWETIVEVWSESHGEIIE